MLEALLRCMMKIVIYCHIILGPHAKNQDQISKIGWFLDNFRFLKHQAAVVYKSTVTFTCSGQLISLFTNAPGDKTAHLLTIETGFLFSRSTYLATARTVHVYIVCTRAHWQLWYLPRYYKGSLQNTNMVGKEKFGMRGGGQSPDHIDDDDNDCDD